MSAFALWVLWLWGGSGFRVCLGAAAEVGFGWLRDVAALGIDG